MKEKTISEHDEALTQAVARLKAGDRSALEEIFRLTGEALYVQARYLTNDEQAAEDLVQTTYVEVIGSIERLEGNSNFLPWAKGILRHKYLDAARRAVHTYIPNDTDAALLIDQMEDEDLAVDPEEITSQHDLQELLLKEIAKLPEEQRVALVLFHFERLSLKEIAEATGVPVNTVKSRLTYARRALKKEIEAYEKEHGVKVRNIGQIITAALASGSALVGTTFLSGGEDEKLWQTLQQIPEFKGFVAGKTLSAGQAVKNVGGLLFFLSAHAGTLVPAALITAGVLSLGIYAGSRLGLADLGRDPYAGTETVTSAYQSASTEESKPAESPKVRPFADQKPDTPVEPTERKDMPESELGKEDEEVAAPQEAESERVEKENAADQTVKQEADAAAETSEAEPRPEESTTERRDIEPAPTPTPDEKPEEGSIAEPEQEETQEEEPVPEEEENPEEEPADAESEEESEQEPETTADENPSDEATDEETNEENDETDAEEDADPAADEEGDGESGGVEEGDPGDEQEPEQEGSADLEDPDNVAIPEINQDGFILVRNEFGEIDYCYSTDGFVSYYQDLNQDVVGVVDESLGYGYCYITEDLLQFGDCFYIPGYGYASPIGLVNQYTFPSYDIDGTPMDTDPYFKCAVTFPTEEEAKAFRYHGTIYPGTFQ